MKSTKISNLFAGDKAYISYTVEYDLNKIEKAYRKAYPDEDYFTKEGVIEFIADQFIDMNYGSIPDVDSIDFSQHKKWAIQFFSDYPNATTLLYKSR